jgi:beta-glucosidase
VYLTHPGVPGAPLRALKGFQRVHLEKGEKKTVTFNLGARDLSVVDESGKHRLVPGQVDVWVGGGQPVSRKGLAPAAGLKTQLTLAHAADLPD